MESVTFCPSDKPFAIGCSQIGKAHIKAGLPNQDSYALYQDDYVTIAVVADGVGSDKNSEYASRNVVQAVVKAILNSDGYIFDRLSEQIQDAFYELMFASPAPLAGTTCVFCAHFANGNMVLGQIGDGICCGYLDDARITLLAKEAHFTNIVNALTVNTSPDCWFIKEYRNIAHAEIMLATDGIADDILPGKDCELAHFLISNISNQSEEQREEYLREILINWETPNSNDDKTIVLYRY